MIFFHCLALLEKVMTLRENGLHLPAGRLEYLAKGVGIADQQGGYLPPKLYRSSTEGVPKGES
jgi:hypothetical protein